MSQSSLKPAWQTAAEYAPSAVFFVAFALTDSLRLAGWSGTVFAIAACTVAIRKSASAHSLFLGINFYFLSITPLIEILHATGFTTAASVINTRARSLVFLAILITGLILSAQSARGFLNVPQIDTATVRRTNRALCVASAGATLWALTSNGSVIVQLAAPMTALFALHAMLKRQATAALTEPRPAPQDTPPK